MAISLCQRENGVLFFKAVFYGVSHTPFLFIKMTHGRFLPLYGVSHAPGTIIFYQFFMKYDEREKSRSSKINMVHKIFVHHIQFIKINRTH